jgi:hypothetical protein
VVEHTLRSLLPDYFQSDLDIAEMFLCFNLHVSMRPYAGVDVTLMRDPVRDVEEGRCRSWERWTRNFMGMRDSPYRSIQMVLVAKVMAYGNREEPNNPFQWQKIVLNLPGSEQYDARLPWVMKVRSDGKLACEIYIYVDDARITGWCKLECWKATRRFSSILAKLGIQDATRKRTEPSWTPGPWAGTVTATNYTFEDDSSEGVSGWSVVTTVTQLKWDKTKALVVELREMVQKDVDRLDRNRLEQIRGFLIYVARTYNFFTPYLKGLHLTIDSWRPDRDEEGYRKKPERKGRSKEGPSDEEEEELEPELPSFKVNGAAIRRAEKDMENGLEVDLEAFRITVLENSNVEPPSVVRAVPRLPEDLDTLMAFLEGETPAVQKCRVSSLAVCLYLMGDASGDGFGSGVWDEDGVHNEAGNWKEQWRKESSNYREASNLTSRIERMGEEGRLRDKELFVFTDNSAFEGTFYKGHSKSSPKLTELIRRLRMVERKYGCIIHAGTRMKFAGVDGLSRGDFLEGIMAGMNPWATIPLNEDANQRSNGRVEEWVRSWWHDEAGTPWCKIGNDDSTYESGLLKRLDPEDWFSLHEVKSHRLWFPPQRRWRR